MSRIAIHDFGGHPFSLQLAGELARRGHEVAYFFCSASGAPNAGRMSLPGTDRVYLKDIVVPPFQKQNFLKRKLQETAYGKEAIRAIGTWRPEILLSSCVPVDAQFQISRWIKRNRIRHVFWFQDIISHAARGILSNKFGLLGRVVADHLAVKEREIAKMSDRIVYISKPFEDQCVQWDIALNKCMLQPNWPVIDQMPVRAKQNEWSIRHNLQNKFVFLYAGTLGFKQEPRLLIDLASSFKNNDGVVVLVISEGKTAEWLKSEAKSLKIKNLMVLPFQDYNQLADVLAAGDVLMTIQSPDSSNYCVPSKVLNYLCAGRAQLAVMECSNQAAEMIATAKCGYVVDPGDKAGYIRAAWQLHDSDASQCMGERARTYADEVFNINSIVDRFIILFESLSFDEPVP